MNIAQSDDNTFAITDVTLEDLAMLWHLFNRGNLLSLRDYVNNHFKPLITSSNGSPTGGFIDIRAANTMPKNVQLMLQSAQFQHLADIDASTFELINEYLSDLDEPLEYVDPLKSIPAQKHQQTREWNVTSKKAPKRKATKTKKLPATDPGVSTTDLHDKYFSGGGNGWGGINDVEIKEMADKLMRSLGVEPIDTNAKGQTLIDMVAEITKEKNTKWTTPRTSSKRGKKNNNK